MRQKLVNAREGFTLLEAMIATMILGWCWPPFSRGFPCARYLTDIRRTARGSQVLQQEWNMSGCSTGAPCSR